jgi:hypothetical protein
LRQQAVGPAFALAYDDCARAAALGAAQRAPTVAGAVAARFGNPARWLGFGPVEATRRFRANWQGCVSPCTTTEQSSPDRASKLRPAATYPQDWQTRP